MLRRLSRLLQPAHVRDFDPLTARSGPEGWLALEPRILLDGAIAETLDVSRDLNVVPGRSPVIDLDGPVLDGVDVAVDYPARETSVAVAGAGAFVTDPQDDIVRLEIVMGGDHIENMDAVRIGDIFINHDRTESFADVPIGGGLFDIAYDADTGIVTIVDADDPSAPMSGPDLSALVRSFRYGNLDLDPREGTLTFDFRAIDAEGNVSIEARAEVVVDSEGAAPYIDLDPDRSGSVGDVFQATFREADGLAISIADTDARVVSTTGEPIRQVVITLLAPQEGDQLRIQVPDDIEGITANIRTLEAGEIRVTIVTSSQAGEVNYEDLARVIRGVTFVNDSEDPGSEQRVVNIQLLEGSTYGVPTRLRLQVEPQNDAPTLDLELGDVTEFGPDYATTWLEDGPGVAIIAVGSSDLEDVDDEVLQSARVVNSNAEPGDRLYIDGGLPEGITAVVSDDGTRVDLSGEASIAAYARALEAVRFAADPDDPTAGTRNVRVQLNDGLANSNTATALVTVVAENDAPIVVGGPLDTLQRGLDGEPLAPVDASESFRDVDDTDLRYSFVGDAPDWLSIDARTGIITGTPPSDASQIAGSSADREGRYEVRVSATDPGNLRAETSVIYQIENPAPVAADDSGTANDGGPRIAGNVLTGEGRDSDPDGDAIFVAFVEDAGGNVGEPVPGSAGGTFVVDRDGGYTFDPGTDFLALTPGETATSAVTYRVSDGQGGFDTATLVVTVLGTNNAPLARDDILAADADRPISGNVMIDNGSGVDSDPDGDRLEVSALNGETFTPGERAELPSGAALTLRLDGGYTYDPGRAYETLGVGATATDTFTYTVRDPFGVTSTATVTVVVAGTNDAPIPLDPSQPAIDPNDPDAPPTDPTDPRTPPSDPQNYIPVQTHVDGETMEPFALATWFGDPDAGDVLTYSVDETRLPAGLTFDLATGTIGGTFASDASQGGRGGVYVVPVTATDPWGASFTTNLTITVANPAPVAADDTFTIGEGDLLTADVFANNGAGEDVDPDGDVLAVTSPSDPVRGSAGGTFTLLPDGTMRFDPGSDFSDLTSGETRETSITYTISDGEGGTTEAVIRVTVEAENDAPVAVGTPATQLGTDGEPVAPFAVSTLVDDPDGDPLTFRFAPGAPPWLSIDPATGVVTGEAPSDGSVGGPEGNGRYPVVVQVSDGRETLDVPLVWTIANPAPTAVDDRFATVAGEPVTGNVLTGAGTDSDPDGDTLLVVGPLGSVAGSDGGTFAFLPDGTVTFDPGGEFADLLRGETRTTEATYTVTDGQGGTDEAVVTVAVTGPNSGPQVVGTADERPGTDAVPIAVFDASTYFADRDGDALTYALAAGAPPWMSIDPVTGLVTGTPPNDASANGGHYPVTIVASDRLGSAELAVDWRIVNPGPLGADDFWRAPSDTALTMDVLANDGDPDDDGITLAAIGGRPVAIGDVLQLESGATLVVEGPNDLVWRPSADIAAMERGESYTETFTYTLVDAQGARSEATARVLITGTQPGPVPPVPIDPGVPIEPPDPIVDPRPPVVPPIVGVVGDPILVPVVGEVEPLGPPIDLDPYSPVPILTQAVAQIERLGGDVSLFGQPILLEALDRIAAREASDARWAALIGDAFRGHELTERGVTFRTVVAGEVTFLDLGSFGGQGFDRWRVTGDGAARLYLIDRNIVQIERPADRDHVHLDVTARAGDGRQWRVPLRVDTVHGEIRLEGTMAPVEPVRRVDLLREARTVAAPTPLPVVDGGRIVDISRPLGAGQCPVPDMASNPGGATEG